MSKEKQIEEMAKDVKSAFDYKPPFAIDAWVLELSSMILAKRLYEEGYRKQSEGEWIEQVKVAKEGKPLLYYYQCNLCGVYLVKQANFCPNCGAKMKGEKQ